MDKRTAGIYKMAILALIENGHDFRLISGKKEKAGKSAGIAGIGANEYSRTGDRLTLQAFVSMSRVKPSTDFIYADEAAAEQEEDPEQEEQEGDA